MALIYIEGFDHLDEYDLEQKDWVAASHSWFTLGSSYSRWASGGGMQITNDLNPMVFNFAGKKRDEMYAGVAMRKVGGSAPSLSSSQPQFMFRDEANTQQVLLCINPAYGINVYRYSANLIAQSADAVVPNGAWFYLEFYAKIHDSAGVVIVRVNEHEVINATGLDTKNGTAYIGKAQLNCVVNDLETWFDDFYVDNAQFHGNVRVRTFMPDSDGVDTDWTRSGGSNDYECIDEAPPNDDTDYIYTLTKGHKSNFGITTGVLSATVKGVQLSHFVKAAASGLRRIRPYVRSGGSDYEGPPSSIIGAGVYVFKKHLWQNDPQDSNPWNQTKLEAANFGLRLVDATTTTSTTTSTTTTVA